MHKNFGKIGKISCSINFISRDLQSLVKKKLIFTVNKNLLSIRRSNIVAPNRSRASYVTQPDFFFFFNQNPPESLPSKLTEHFSHSFQKIILDFHHRGAEYDEYRQNYFYRNFCFEKTFQEKKRGRTFALEILNSSPPQTTTRRSCTSSIFASPDSFLKNVL